MEHSQVGNIEEDIEENLIFLEDDHPVDVNELIIEQETHEVVVVHEPPPQLDGHAPPPLHDAAPPAWAAGLVAMVQRVQDELSLMKTAA